MCARSGDNETQLLGKIADIDAEIKEKKIEYKKVQAELDELKRYLRDTGLDVEKVASHPGIVRLSKKEERLANEISELRDDEKTFKKQLEGLRAGSSQPALVTQPVRARTPTMIHRFGHHGHACTICS